MPVLGTIPHRGPRKLSAGLTAAHDSGRQALRPEPWRDRHARCGGAATPRFGVLRTPRIPNAGMIRGPILAGLALLATASVPCSSQAHTLPSVPNRKDAPSSETAVTAWLAADRWVRDGQVPPSGSENAEIPLQGVEAISMALRLDGRIVASGDAEGLDADATRRATGRLLAELSAALASRWPDEMHDAVRRQALLEIDLAGAPEPLLGATFGAAAASIDPGLDTLAVRRGDRWARAFPGRLLSSGLAGDPAATLARLATETGLPRGADLRELLRLDSVGLYRMPTTRLVQPRPGAMPEIAIRYDSATPSGPIGQGEIRRLASDLLGHLGRCLHPDRPVPSSSGEAPPSGLGLRGDLDPIAGRHEPFAAPPLAQAVALLAATRLAEADADLAPAAVDLAERLMDDLGVVDPIEANPLDSPEALAAVAIAATLRPSLADRSPDTEAFVAAAVDAVEAATRPETFDTLSPGRRAILAAAAATLAAAGDAAADPADRLDDAGRLLQRAWSTCDPTARVGLLPWFVWAASRLPDSGGLGEPLEAFRDRLGELQLESIPIVAEDLVGGFDLEQGPRPRADARSVLPGLGLAMMLADGDLTPRSADPKDLETLRDAIASQRRALGFLRRSTATAASATRLPRAEHAPGGVRDAPWDPRQSTMVQAIALWWLAECLASGLP